MTKLKRKQLLLDIENAPDGHYGIYPGGNVPDVQPGDKLELAIDKIITIIDKMSPASAPLLSALTLIVTESLDGPVGPSGVNNLSGAPASNVYRFVNGEVITFTTFGNPLDVDNRNGHFNFDAIDSAILRFRHVKVTAAQTKTVDIVDLETLINPPLDNVLLQTDSTNGYDITTIISEFRDFYADDPELSASQSGFFNSIKSVNTTELVTGFNENDTDLRQVYLEYSESGLFNDTITVGGAPYEYRLEDNPGSNMVGGSVSFSNFPTMLGLVSGVPTLEVGDTIRVQGQVNNGIKKYYPTIIANSTVTATDNVDDTLAGAQVANSIWVLASGAGLTHSFKANQYSETIAGFVTPYDIFSSGTIGNATTLVTFRIDTKSLALALTDSATRYLSPANTPTPVSIPQLAAGPWDQPLSGAVGGYDMTAHQSTLDQSTGPYRQNLQVLNGLYQYPDGDYSPYSGPNYSTSFGTSGSNFPGADWRYVDIEVGVLAGVTFTWVVFDGANWNEKLPNALSFLLRVDGASGTGDDGWLNINAAYQGGDPTGSSATVGLGQARDAYDFTPSDANGRRRRVTFGSIAKTGTVTMRVGIQNGSGFSFKSITVQQS